MDEFEGFVHGYSPKALLFQGHYWHAPIWLPRSQMRVVQPLREGEEAILAVKRWLCDKNSIAEFTETRNDE